MKYVTIRVEGRVIVSVDDDLDLDEAIELANYYVSNADFGPNEDENVSPLEDIDWHCVCIEEDDGNRTYLD
jgi:hypothetical protein